MADLVGLRLADGARKITRILVLSTGDTSRICFWTVPVFRGACLAIGFMRAVAAPVFSSKTVGCARLPSEHGTFVTFTGLSTGPKWQLDQEN